MATVARDVHAQGRRAPQPTATNPSQPAADERALLLPLLCPRLQVLPKLPPPPPQPAQQVVGECLTIARLKMVGVCPLLPQKAFPGLRTLIGLRRPGSCFLLMTTELQDPGQGTRPPCCAVAITVGWWDGESLGYRLFKPHPGPDLCSDAVAQEASAPPVVGECWTFAWTLSDPGRSERRACDPTACGARSPLHAPSRGNLRGLQARVAGRSGSSRP